MARTFVRTLLFLAAAACPAAARPAEREPSLGTVLALYAKAMNDPGSGPVEVYEISGTTSGAGLAGTFHQWSEPARERSDSSLGPRSERLLRIGDRYWYLDENAAARELTGVLARRARTQDFIDSGAFAEQPERCTLRGSTTLGGKSAFALDVTAEGGDTETLYLDASSGLPLRLTYDEDDARTTVDLYDWRTVSGHRFAFKSVTSNGDHAYDATQTTESVTLGGPISPDVFVPLEGRRIDMDGIQTVALDFRDGHYYLPARIAGHDYTFLLDSGSQNVVVDTRVASELGLSLVGSLEASGAKRTGGLALVRLAELDVGGGKLHDLVAAAIDLRGSTEGVFKIDGILGYPFFASAEVKFDPSARTITFGKPGAFAPAGDKIAVDVDRGFPEARLRANDVDASFLIDTGNAGEVLLYKPFVDAHAGIVPYTATTRNSYGIGGSTESHRTTLDELDVGSLKLFHAETDVMEATRGAFADRFDAGNVGLGVLKNFVLTFDLANAALYVQRGPDFDDGRTRT